jgi:mono/diheme cytochrome c family protein
MERLGAALCVLALALGAVGCGGGGGEAAPEGTTQERAREGDPTVGKQVFLKAGCGVCHTFEAAGTTQTVGPNLDLVVETYDEAFIKKSIVDPEAYTEKTTGEPGSIGGDRPYHATMPPFGPKAEPANRLTEQQLADLVAFLTQGQ